MKFALDAKDCPTSRLSDWQPHRGGLREWTEYVEKRGELYVVSLKRRATQLATLNSFGELRSGWDSYGAEPPSATAIESARLILRVLWEYEGGDTIRLSPSVEGGVGIIFGGRGKKYADIECFNDGEILAITSEGPEPSIWTVGASPEDFRAAIEKITAFLNG